MLIENRYYSKSELALIIFPDSVNVKQALNRFNYAVNKNEVLLNELKKKGYFTTQRHLNPSLVKMILSFLYD